MNTNDVSVAIRNYVDAEYAKHSPRFFKTSKGEYGEGDLFLGVRVSILRKLSKLYRDISAEDAGNLLQSNYHEDRLCVLFILTHHFQDGTKLDKAEVYQVYTANTQYINNWDLVDASAYKIVGAFLYDRNRAPSYEYVKSKSL